MARESAVSPVIGGKPGSDDVIAALADRQHGVVSRRQLLDLGLGARAIDHRLAQGRLHALHRGVFAVGHRVLSKEARWTAAVLAAGPGAVLSHASAAALWELRPNSRGAIDVTVAAGKHSRPGIRVHRANLPPDELTIHHGIPVTTPSRTIFDLAAELPHHRTERAISELERLRLPDPVSLHELLTRHPQSRGSKSIRLILADFEPTLTRQEFEYRFRVFLATTDLPLPAFNEPLVLASGRQFTPDCLWRSHRLIVELDGRAAHARRLAFEADRARDRALTVAGYRVIRITWRQLRDEPHAVVADLSKLLLGAV